MNATEKIVEAYFRLCRNCFTISDVKVIKGNNRQIDLLAYSLKDKKQYHVEASVTHCQNWYPTKESLLKAFDNKFFGIPAPKEGKNTDSAKGKEYKKSIDMTYEQYGMNSNDIKRVWVCWTLPEDERKYVNEYCQSKRIESNPIEILEFRNDILPQLLDKISTSNYEDEILRTLSLLEQYRKQQQ